MAAIPNAIFATKIRRLSKTAVSPGVTHEYPFLKTRKTSSPNIMTTNNNFGIKKVNIKPAAN